MMPDSLHIDNARIWTGDFRRPWARSITIRNGRVESLDNPAPAKERRIDAHGRVITPGLIDSHMHLLKGGLSMAHLDLSHVRSRAEFERAIAKRHAELGPGQWLIAGGWSSENWPGGELPDKSWLQSAGGRPCACYRMDMHAVLVNDAVLAMCAPGARSDPVGGRIVRDGRGEPTGLHIEAAAWQLVNPLVPSPGTDAKRQALLGAQAHVHALGLTAVGSMEYQRDVEDVFEPLRNKLTLRCRITLLDRSWPTEFTFGREFENDDALAVIGYKAFIDGTLGSRSARMLRDYADEPGNRGLLVELAADGTLLDWAKGVAAAGLSPSMHAIGDEAARIALDILDGVGEKCRARIEHAQQIDRADLPRFHRRIASMQPLHKADDCRYVRSRLGDDRLASTFAFRRLLEAGAVLAFGSDWPVVSCDPLLGIRTAVTGLTLDGKVFGGDQNLTVEESLRAYTRDAAFCLQMDDAGVLAEGKVGDLVMFDRDPFVADWGDAPPRVVMTVCGGRVVYDASEDEATRQALTGAMRETVSR